MEFTVKVVLDSGLAFKGSNVSLDWTFRFRCFVLACSGLKVIEQFRLLLPRLICFFAAHRNHYSHHIFFPGFRFRVINPIFVTRTLFSMIPISPLLSISIYDTFLFRLYLP